MRILAIETSTRDSSIAAFDNDLLLGQTEFGSDQRTTQAFAPAIAKQLEVVGWRPSDVQLIVVSQGPGSFTGLRVGITAAKTLAYATGASVLGVDTLQVCAAQAAGDWPEISVVTDAQRQQLFAGRFRREGNRLEIVVPTHIVDVSWWLESLAPGQFVTGAGLSKLLVQLPTDVRVSDASDWLPKASTLGRIGYQDYLAGRRDDLWKLAPHYYRQSAAEEKVAVI
ncbi:MAG: tRNA (adenosine(37)-N6)-threonylcarbamoyltransferase complex dimerization subunit type 1 TsaB [Pirellulaceae bacterium]|nr:tRNA (adenosine(37)-N6)-threonylcarbamoyltransferase complex dimerization subunit type 1 TsaB [Pirellulaceae bacterium]